MAKVLTKDIAKVLAEKKGLSYEEAEGYVNSFFSLVDDSLIGKDCLDKGIRHI